MLTETIFELMGITPTLHGGQAQAKLDEHQPVFMPVGAFCPPLENNWRCAGGWACVTVHIPAKLATPFAEGEALRLSSVSHPEYIGRVAKFFSDIGGRALLMHGTEGEVYANPQRCPQINLIDREGMRVLYENRTLLVASYRHKQKIRKPRRSGLSVALLAANRFPNR